MRKILAVTLLILLVACAPKQPDLTDEINIGIIGTLAARPTATVMPSPTPVPTMGIGGMFCEYDFCIGHPASLPLFDANGAENPAAHSTYASGKLLGFRDNLFILVTWVQSTGTWDPQGMSKIVIDEFGAAPIADMDINLVGDLNVGAQPITPPPNSVFTSGTVASWRCGDRDFVWMGFSTGDGSPSMLDEALAKFRCEEK